MNRRGPLGLAPRWRTSVGLVLLGVLWGCAALPPNSLFDPTKVGKFGLDVYEGSIRQVLTPRDTPPGIPNATEPTPEDLVAQFAEYRVRLGDVLSVTVNDLITPGVPYSAAIQVNSLGEIRLPLVGSIKVTGLTEQGVEQELAARLREAELLPQPIVIVFVQNAQGRRFNIIGAVPRPGPYPIMSPDMRMLEAIAMVGDVAASSRTAYVIRRPHTEQAVEIAPAPVDGEDWVVPPPGAEPASFAVMAEPSGASRTGPMRDVDEPNEPLDAREELGAAVAPAKPADASSGDETEAPTFPSLIFDPATGEVVEAETATMPEEQTPVADDDPNAYQDLEEFELPFDWEDVEGFELEQRVIRINLEQLKAGDPRQNIVVRSGDVINVPVDDGVFYLMGEVARPGVYGFGGREITVKQAIAIAGGFGPLAWPQRCEVIRREPGTDKQLVIPVNLDAIFAGLEDDFYLRDEDVLNVGTHVVAPFLFVMRNSFRFTYGFGFVYDRNFADKDSYGGRTNPETLARIQRQQRGLPF